jgi:hypothetical protein
MREIKGRLKEMMKLEKGRENKVKKNRKNNEMEVEGL